MQLTRKLGDASDATLVAMSERIAGLLEDCEQHLGGDLITALYKVAEKAKAEQARRASASASEQNLQTVESKLSWG